MHIFLSLGKSTRLLTVSQNVDSDDHKSHVAFPSTGPDNGTCDDPNYPVTIPRIFMEVCIYTSLLLNCCVISNFAGVLGDAGVPRPARRGYDTTTALRVRDPILLVLVFFGSDDTCRFSNGDPTGYGYHADFFNGWESGVLQKAINECHCNPYGDPSCCVAAGTFTIDQDARCFVSNTIDEISMSPFLPPFLSLP